MPEFKKVSDTDKLKEFKNLLKAYQSEIDSITKRSKYAEGCFLTLYKALCEVPDPCVSLQTALAQSSQVSELSLAAEDNKRLKEEVAQLNSQIASAKSSEATIGNLKQRLSKYEAMLDEMVASKVLQKEEEMKTLMDEKIRVYKETEYALNRQLSHFKDQLANLQSNHDVTQAKLAKHSETFDHGVAAQLAQVEIMALDLERCNAKISHMEMENEMLKRQLDSADADSDQSRQITALQDSIANLTSTNQQLEQAATELKARNSQLQVSVSQHSAESEREVAAKVFEIARLQAQLQEYSDYDEIKNELNIMKGIEFDGLDDSLDSASEKPSLHTLLMAKNKKLQTETTSLTVELQELKTALANHEADIQVLTRSLNTAKQLNAKLEADMLKLNTATWSKPQPPPPDSFETLISDTVRKPKHESTLPSPTQHQPPTNIQQSSNLHEASIIPILTSQRDRYKQRYEDLETQWKAQSQKISDLTYEVTRLKADNVKLYEKMRYTESFNTGGVNILIGRSGSVKNGDAEAWHKKYEGMYEETLDPFKQFHKQEEERKYRSMNAAERAAFSLTRVLTTNKYSRVIFVVYSGMLHVLVFMMMYHMGSDHSCNIDHEQNSWEVHKSTESA